MSRHAEPCASCQTHARSASDEAPGMPAGQAGRISSCPHLAAQQLLELDPVSRGVGAPRHRGRLAHWLAGRRHVLVDGGAPAALVEGHKVGAGLAATRGRAAGHVEHPVGGVFAGLRSAGRGGWRASAARCSDTHNQSRCRHGTKLFCLPGWRARPPPRSRQSGRPTRGLQGVTAGARQARVE